MQSFDGIGARRHDLLEPPREPAIEGVPFEQHALREIAHRAVAIAQGIDERLEVAGGPSRRLRRRVFGGDAPDAAKPDRSGEPALVDLLPQEGRHVGLVLDDAAVHVRDVERAVRTDRERHRPEPLVGAREELAIGESIPRDRQPIVLRHVEPLDRVRRRLADERVAGELGAEERRTIEDGAARGGQVRERAVRSQRVGPVAAVDPRRHPDRKRRGVDADPPVDALEPTLPRIARCVLLGKEIAAQALGVGRVVEAAEVVHGDAPLAVRGNRNRGRGASIELDEHAAVGEREAIVDGSDQAVRRVLGILEGAEFDTEVDLGIGDAVAVLVGAEEERGRLDEKRPAVGRRDRPRHHEIVEEGRGVLEDAVAVAILEDLDPARRRLLAMPVGVGHVAPHLDDPESALLVEDDRDRIFDERLRGDEVDSEARQHVERFERRLRREHRSLRDLEMRNDVRLRFVLDVAVLGDGHGRSGEARRERGEARSSRRATRGGNRHLAESTAPTTSFQRVFSRSRPAGSAPARRCRRPAA